MLYHSKKRYVLIQIQILTWYSIDALVKSLMLMNAVELVPNFIAWWYYSQHHCSDV